ncbi:YjjG family noncanonical pyrimidine nucleotidase [Sphaerochaeta sp. S2]|uniref:YjjG family noncanonical pyrimidine nucleotidase n=1 Tax=Sphaerochaeta sp. S2 TaxID=2798868 RepID=UPI0018E9D40A|nr:YjjG family noncanonical pyrimidine nucleotidase [Sphaerochaeta sp. S2]MBJ2355335.1 YjjG family noncanonical pyrimidine nucleotidase [Sphaerochaeta sp. S2]
MYRYLFFDADGTLFDFEQAEHNAFWKMAESLNLPLERKHEQDYIRCNAEVWKQFEKGEVTIEELKVKRFANFAWEIGIPLNPEEASQSYQQQLSRQGILFDETITVLETLKKRGYTLFLATNGIAEVQRGRIAISDTEQYFDHIFISEEIGYQKPDPRFFAHMFEATGLSEQKQHTLMIGDSLSSDIAGGIAGGMETLWLNKTGKPVNPQVQPTHIHNNLYSVLEFLNGPL